eukprot:TRINITY_DN495_c0_g1_i10.p1 TRINITY_DN495_c0_g1~~TRINITY_DN495_c0_g1_i10.p1  ORF type:complete len:167 (-),score=25.38 TRINITY_DN495_c0_g1_i10:442-942(-)
MRKTCLTAEDQDVLHSLFNLTFPFESWNHLAHLRVAFSLCAISNTLSSEALNESCLYQELYQSMKKTILAYNAKHSEKLKVGFHETITQFWLHLILHFFLEEITLNEDLGDLTFQTFINNHPELTSFPTTFEYYEREQLFSPEAKEHFVLPTSKPLPRTFTTASKS